VCGRIDAAAIAFSTAAVSSGTARICATCDPAVGVKSSAAMMPTISSPQRTTPTLDGSNRADAKAAIKCNRFRRERH
jgi:hypothetical protein